MKSTFIGIIEAGEPLIRQTLESIHKTHEAESSGLSEHEVRRLKLLADSLYQAVIDFQLVKVKTGEQPAIIH